MLSPVVIGIMIAIILQGMLRDGVTTWMPSYIADTYHLGTAVSILTGVVLPLFSIICTQISSSLYRKRINNPVTCSVIMFLIGTVVAIILYCCSGSSAIISIICSAIYEVSQKSIELPINNNVIYELGNYEFTTPYILNQTTNTNNSNVYQYHPNGDTNKNCLFQINRTYTNNYVNTFLTIEQQKYPNYNVSSINTDEKVNKITWYYQYLYPQITNDYVRIDAMKDFYSNEIYSITTLSYNTNECEVITNDIKNNFKKKN